MTVSLVHVLLIALGGGLGSMARAGIAAWCSRHAPAHFGTLAINLTGSFLIGVIYAWYLAGPSEFVFAERSAGVDFLALGFLGGYTTVSAFALQVQDLWQQNKLRRAVAYGVGSVLLCPAAAFLGLFILRWFSRGVG